MSSTLLFKASPPDGFVANPFVPWLDTSVEFTIWPQSDPTQLSEGLAEPTLRQLDLAARVMEWPNEMRNVIDNAAEDYRAEMDNAEELDHINRSNIRKHYEIYGIAIPSFEKIEEGVDYIWFMAGCDWEEEHGMECIFRNQEVIYCRGNDCLYQQPHFREWDHLNWG